MPDIKHCLHDQDMGFLNITAELWGIENNAPDACSFRPILATAMQDKQLFEEMTAALPKSASKALVVLAANGGKMPWAHFSRAFGDIRNMGPAKRDREKPFRNPISPAEILWYRAMIGRDFMEAASGLQEFAYVPEEFLPWLPKAELQSAAIVLPDPFNISDSETIQLANDRILDQLCTLLAALRRTELPSLPNTSAWTLPEEHLSALAKALKLITPDGMPDADHARPWLESSRADALLTLASGWTTSSIFNELRLVPSLKCEGTWQNDPLKARTALLDLIQKLDAGTWWSVDSFIQYVHQLHPDFQRSAGEYDTWLIRSTQTSGMLIGLQLWFEVEGALIRYMLQEPLHALGLVDLAFDPDDKRLIAFRKTMWFEPLMLGVQPGGLGEENAPLTASSAGLIEMSTNTSRIARYQVSRFCEWVFEHDGLYRYRLTPKSLHAAGEQGLKPAHLISLLHKYSKTPPPPALIKAIKRWASNGQEAVIKPLVVLKVASPEILSALRESPAARFLDEPLGPVSIVVKESGIDKVLAALARLGYLADVEK